MHADKKEMDLFYLCESVCIRGNSSSPNSLLRASVSPCLNRPTEDLADPFTFCRRNRDTEETGTGALYSRRNRDRCALYVCSLYDFTFNRTRPAFRRST